MEEDNEESVEKAAVLIGRSTPLDMLINTASLQMVMNFNLTNSLKKKDMMRLFEIHAVGSLLVTRAFLPNLKHVSNQGKLSVLAHITAHTVPYMLEDGSLDDFNYGYNSLRSTLCDVHKTLAVELQPQHICCVSLNSGELALSGVSQEVGKITENEKVIAEEFLAILLKCTAEDCGRLFQYSPAPFIQAGEITNVQL